MNAAFTDALAAAILHLCWQATALALLAALLLRAVPRRQSGARYAVTLGALAACVLAFAGTFLVAYEAPLALDDFTVPAAALVDLPEADLARRFSQKDLLALLWGLGVTALSLRLLNGVRWARRLKGQASATVPTPWLDVVDQLRRQQGLRKPVSLRACDAVESPAIVGWLVPMILVPTSAFTALTPDQLRCVLAHELAHLRRHDHLVNALQAWIEVLLFFHPAVWWLSNRVREEREYCCDLAALRVTGSPKLLAQALTRLESLRLHSPSLALAARSNRSPLMKRITRILDQQPDSRRTVGWGFSTLLSVTVLALGAGVAHATTAEVAPSEPVAFEWSTLAERAPKDEEEYRQIEARLLEAVAAGDLSVAEAQRTLAALRKNMLGGGKAKPKDDKKESVDGAVQKIKDAVAAGKLSKEDAVQKIKALQGKELAEKKAREQDKKTEARYEKFAAVERKLEEAVKAGKLSKEEAHKKLAEIERELFQASDRAQPEKAKPKQSGAEEGSKRRYLEAEKKIRAAVDAGKISREDGTKKLEGFKKDLEAQAEADSRYKRLEKEAIGIRKAQAEGKMGREEAARRLEEVRRKLEGGVRTDRRDARDADDRLEALGREIEGEGRRRRSTVAPESARDRAPERTDDARIARYREIQAKIEAAVKSGDLSKEEAEKKLMAVRMEMFRAAPDQMERRSRSTRETDRAERPDRVERRVRGAEQRDRTDRVDRPDRVERKERPDVDRAKESLDLAKMKIDGAVAAGLMTEEEAKETLAKVVKKLDELRETEGRIKRR